MNWIGPYGRGCSEPYYSCSNCNHLESTRGHELPNKCPKCGEKEIYKRTVSTPSTPQEGIANEYSYNVYRNVTLNFQETGEITVKHQFIRINGVETEGWSWSSSEDWSIHAAIDLKLYASSKAAGEAAVAEHNRVKRYLVEHLRLIQT